MDIETTLKHYSSLNFLREELKNSNSNKVKGSKLDQKIHNQKRQIISHCCRCTPYEIFNFINKKITYKVSYENKKEYKYVSSIAEALDVLYEYFNIGCHQATFDSKIKYLNNFMQKLAGSIYFVNDCHHEYRQFDPWKAIVMIIAEETDINILSKLYPKCLEDSGYGNSEYQLELIKKLRNQITSPLLELKN